MVLSHLRAGVKVGLRARGIRVSDRAHEEHVQELVRRSDWCRNGDATDIIARRIGEVGGVMSS